MWQIFTTIAPYALGLIISPIPIIVVILLLVGRGGIKKATVFEIAWVGTTFLVTFLLAMLLGSVQQGGDDAVWKDAAAVAMGSLLIVIAMYIGLNSIQIRKVGRPHTPKWLRAIDGASGGKIFVVTGFLILFNPVNLGMILAAALGIAGGSASTGEGAALAFLFALLGSVAVLLPYFAAIIAGRKADRFLHTLRRLMIRYNGQLSFWSTLAFGIFFLTKGL